MPRTSPMLRPLAVGAALVLCPLAVDAQFPPPPPPPPIPVSQPRFELTPLGGYQWGGSFDTNALGPIPSGELGIKDGFAWGGIISFRTPASTALELLYLRQDSDLEFKPSVGSAGNAELGFSMNYIQIGGRREFMMPSGLAPFIAFSVGVNVMDGKEDTGSETNFAWSLGGGAQYMFAPARRIGLRFDARWWVTPVSSGDYGTWCGFYGCAVVEGTTWLNQGQASAGLTVAF